MLGSGVVNFWSTLNLEWRNSLPLWCLPNDQCLSILYHSLEFPCIWEVCMLPLWLFKFQTVEKLEPRLGFCLSDRYYTQWLQLGQNTSFNRLSHAAHLSSLLYPDMPKEAKAKDNLTQQNMTQARRSDMRRICMTLASWVPLSHIKD